MNLCRRLACVITAFALSGCYVSKVPLITPSTADYPLMREAHFDSFVPQGKGWRPQAGRRIERLGAYYVYATDGEEKKSPPFLLKRVARRSNFYVAQMNDRSDQKKVSE